MAIEDLKSKLKAKFSRRLSTTSTQSHSSADGDAPGQDQTPSKSRKAHSIRSRASHKASSIFGGRNTDSKDGDGLSGRENPDTYTDAINTSAGTSDPPASAERKNIQLSRQGSDQQATPTSTNFLHPQSLSTNDDNKQDKSSTADFPPPNTDIGPVQEEAEEELVDGKGGRAHDNPESSTKSVKRPADLSRRQSLLPHQQTRLIQTLLETELSPHPGTRDTSGDYFTAGPSTISGNMVSRKIWVKRPGASATLVQIHEDDLVDDVREMILKKYTNSLGRSFDAPDVTLRIINREQRQERVLGPEEPMGRTLDAYYPGGQTVEEALLIDVPHRRTPRPSPQPQRGYYDENRPAEAGTDYFPPMPIPAAPSPHLPNSVPPPNSQTNHHPALPTHSMSVLTTGHIPALPSPGGSSRRHHRERPRIGRQHTSSPTIVNGGVPQPSITTGTQVYSPKPRSRTHSSSSEQSAPPPTAPPLPTPPAQQQSLSAEGLQIQRVATPPPRVSSPRPTTRPKKKKAAVEHPSLPPGMLNGAVPPINVLIVEDNIINLKLLEAFMKRLKVRWQTAMNGKAAVDKWRAGGFHLVLMDIQLPIMSGLEATKEIRRLERLNSIGVFSSSASSNVPEQEGSVEPEGDDKLPDKGFFKSPVIIVALTASSLQSDRHEALAAGCNDFLTKPVNFVWLERKVMEWGCMQALIDFDGWRKWKDFSQQNEEKEKEKALAAKKKKNRMSLGSNAAASSSRSALGEGVAVS